MHPLSEDERCQESQVEKVLSNVEAGEDNRNARDRSENGQNMKREQIEELKEEAKGNGFLTKFKTQKYLKTYSKLV